jgi:hypothetical protein
LCRSGRKYKSIAVSADAPNLVPNIRLNCLGQLREQFLDKQFLTLR